MNFKTTLILLAVLLVVGTTALIVVKHTPSDELSPVDRTLLSVKAADVTSIAIENSDGDKIVITRPGSTGAWTITQPIKVPASGDTVGTILNDLTGLVSTREMTLTGASDELHAYGLDHPQYSVRLEAGDKHISLLVGLPESIGGGLYVEQEGTGKLEVVSSTLLPDLQKKVGDLRDKKLVDLTSTADLNTVTIAKPDGDAITLTRDTSVAPWRMTAPTSMPADTSAVEAMLDPLVTLSASSFVDDADVAKVPPSSLKPQLTITYTPNAPITGATSKPTTQPSSTIVFGGYDDLQKQNIYVQVGAGKVLAKVPASTLVTFNKKPLDLRDKNIVKIDRTMVSKITLDTEAPATTSPASRPAIIMGVSLSRRPQSHILGPDLPTGFAPTTSATQATTMASTQSATTQIAAMLPATMPTTAATTMPIVPPSTWIVDATNGDADDEAVQELLTDLDPLTVDHYIEKLPTTQPSHIYRLTVTTVGPGGSPVTEYPIQVIDPNPIDQPYGVYNGVPFVAQRMLVTHLDAKFAKNPPATQPTTQPAATQP
jgi:hypothetical protein